MGAWDAYTFGNDAACDWAFGLDDVNDLSLVHETFEAVLNADDFLDSDIACEGLAACEVVARLKGNWGVRNSYSEDVDKWVIAHPIKPPETLVKTALAVIDRVLAANSELREIWEDANATEWLAAVADLRERVSR